MTALALTAPAEAPANAPRFVEGLFTAARLGEAGRPMFEVAVALAEAGWPVFPCHPLTKQPILVAHGFKDRSLDLQLIKRWWSRLREATVGIVPADGGLVALDVDSPSALAALQAAGLLPSGLLDAGLLPSGLLDALKARAPDGDLGSAYGLIVVTGGKSAPFEFEGVTIPPMHWYLRAEGAAPSVPGVVCRYDNGYVIAGGSRGRNLYRLLGRGEPASFEPTPVTEPPALTMAPATLDAARPQTQRAPGIERVRQAVACIPIRRAGAPDQRRGWRRRSRHFPRLGGEIPRCRGRGRGRARLRYDQQDENRLARAVALRRVPRV